MNKKPSVAETRGKLWRMKRMYISFASNLDTEVFRSHVQWRIGHLYIDFTFSVQLFTRVAHLWWIRWDRTAFTWRKTSSYLNEFSIRLHDHVESLRCIGVHMTRIISENRRYILITCRLTSTEGPPTPARWSRYMHNTSSFIYFAYLLIVHVV